MRKNLLVTLSQGMVEYLLFFPILLIIGILVIGPSLSIWLITIFVLFLVGLMYKTLFPYQHWLVYAVVSLLIGVLSSCLFYEQLLFGILLAMIHPIFIYRGMMYASHAWNRLLSTGFLWFGGFIIYFISYFLFRYVEKLYPYLTLITVCGVIAIVLILFLSNSVQLKSATLSKQEQPFISRTIKKQNQIFLGITVILIVIVTNAYVIWETLFNRLRAIIQWLLRFTSSSEGEPVTEQAPPAMAPDLGLERGEPSALAKFLEMIMIYIFYVFLVFAVIALILLFIKKSRLWLKKTIHSLFLFLKQIMNRTTEQKEADHYVDEKESVFDWKEWSKEQRDKAKGLLENIFKREPRWESLSNQQKVRFVYRRYILQRIKLFNYKVTNTPRETLHKLKVNSLIEEKEINGLRDAYERTRYGEEDIGKDKIDEIYSFIKDK